MRIFRRAMALAGALASAVGLAHAPAPSAPFPGAYAALGASQTSRTGDGAAVVSAVSLARAHAPRITRLLDRRTPGRSRQAWVIRKRRRGAAYAAVLT